MTTKVRGEWIDVNKMKGKKIKWKEEDELKKVEKAIKEGFEESEKFMNRNYKSKPTTTGEKKSIAVIIREMMEECEKIGRHPVCIKLSEKDYKKLFNYLKKDRDMYFQSGYEVVPIGVRYHPKPLPKRINTFMGLPVEIGDYTIVTWL